MFNVKLERQKGRNVTINDVNLINEVWRSQKTRRRRFSITFRDDQGREFHSRDVWIKNKGIRPLSYYGGNIHQCETLGQLLVFLNVESTKDLIGKRIYAYPDPEGYLVPVCFEPFSIEYKNNN